VSLNVGALLESLGIDARKRGTEWTAFCPNPEHRDRKPSWRMVDDPGDSRHGKFNCFPCGFGGDAITLVRFVLDVGYHAAKSWVSEYETEDEELSVAVQVAAPRTFRLPSGVEQADILDWPRPFRRYLAERRLTVSQVRRWGLAYAIEGRLAGRVVIPTRSSSGRLLSYTARAVDRGSLRYLTPAREEGADPGAVFGEEHWGPGGTVAVTEGSFDALAIERAVSGLAVAVLGTGGASHAEDPRVLAKLSRFARVIVVTDPNPAGDRAHAALEAGLRSTGVVLRARPPKGTDAAEMAPRDLRGMIEAAR
jgi:DNA primase